MNDAFKLAAVCCDHIHGGEPTADEMNLFEGCYDLIKSEWWTTIPHRLPYEESMSTHGEFTCKTYSEMVVNG